MGRTASASPRSARLLGLAVLVALAHGWLLSGLVGHEPLAPRAVAARGIVVVALPRPMPLAEAAVPAAPLVPSPPAGPQGGLAHAAPRRSAPAEVPALVPTLVPGQMPALPAQAAAELLAPGENIATAPSLLPEDGEPPPVYPTRVPAPAALRFAARIDGVDADAELTWQHDGERYRLELRVPGPRRHWVEQLSEGGFDAAGLAPERFLDRRRGRTVGAAHFRRDIGRISFSGPRVDYPAFAGAQDRLAWLPQLVAVMAAADEPPQELRFFVADARGVARHWVFRAQGSEDLDSAAGPVRAFKLVREPARADDLRVAVWLDPATGYWPVRLEFGVPISGATLQLNRRGFAPAEPPALPSGLARP